MIYLYKIQLYSIYKNGKYDCYIKRTTDNVLQILLQGSRWRAKTANTILQIPWKKVKSDANTPTWSKHSARVGYLRKIPVLRLNFPRHSAREIFRLSTGIFRKYPSQAWYIWIEWRSDQLAKDKTSSKDFYKKHLCRWYIYFIIPKIDCLKLKWI
jgi:hypothetical protein